MAVVSMLAEAGLVLTLSVVAVAWLIFSLGGVEGTAFKMYATGVLATLVTVVWLLARLCARLGVDHGDS